MAHLIRELVRQYQARIRACTQPELGRDILTEITVARHNYFAQEFCESTNLTYRNDVPALEIVQAIRPGFDPMSRQVPDLTPDNFLIHGNKMYIIDFKVSVSDESSIHTYRRYTERFTDIFNFIGVDFEVVIIRMDPSNMQLHISSDNFLQLYPNIILNLDFSWYFRLKNELFERFRDSEEFMELVAHGEFTPTIPWVTTETPELYDHPVFIDFLNSMPPKDRNNFLRAMSDNAFHSDKWNDLLHTMMREYGDKYKAFIKDMAKRVFLADSNYDKPTRLEIQKGWSEMILRVKESRNMTTDVHKQKPSIHFIWSPHDPKKTNENSMKLLMLSAGLQDIKEKDPFSIAFKHIGKLMDFRSDIRGYERFCARLKQDARSTPKSKSSKIEPLQIDSCTVLWEQQFKMDTGIIPKDIRLKFLKEFCGIGNHKQFKNRMLDDLDLDKPVILDFSDPDIQKHANLMFQDTKSMLSKESGLYKIGNVIEEFKDKIINANAKTWETIESIAKTRFWQAMNDFSILVKNILSVSQYNKHNTFRVVCTANNQFFGIVYPSASIQSRKSTIVFSTVTFHDEAKDVIKCGSLFRTYKITKGYMSISKAIRLDKERCQRLVTAPGIFLLTTLLLKGDTEIDLNEVMAFAFFTSLSITKSMLSLTEPSRYMIMNSLAVSSHVREYISEKFSPYTKTLFSVYMTELIRRGCMSANNQRTKISVKDVFLNEFEITQKGVSENRDLESIWFPGFVNLKEYINQIYLPFYFNAKGLHNKHHVIIDLAKTVLEIELEQREELPNPWGEDFKKQSVNLDILIYSIAKMLKNDTSKHNHLRSRVENRNNFKRSLASISTFTSSKSCIKVGDFYAHKSDTVKRMKKIQNKEAKRTRIANTEFVDEEDRDLEIAHSTYLDLIKSVPNYTDYISTKVFDRLYEKFKTEEFDDRPAIEIIMDVMKDHKNFKFCFFNKGQKTAKDREIFVGELEAKLCLYCVERISKERCKLNPEEMISEPGDGKLKKLEMNSESELRYLIEMTRRETTKEGSFLQEFTSEPKGIKIEINADMSKWSAQDVFFKYFWLIALDPILYPYEKQRILYFLCNYMDKELILPDELMCSLLDQKAERENDIIRQMTNNFHTNTVNIRRNWLQGNLNYTSSYIHSCSMMVFKDIVKECSDLLEGNCNVNSMVHSDDNQTSVIMIQDKIHNDCILNFICKLFEACCLTFGNQANMKKTYITNNIKEFVSLFNIYGEPFSVYGRFLLPAVGDCAYIGPYEDMASRLSATQTAIKHGCPPSLAWVSIALNHWITFNTYNMLPGQANDPSKIFNCERSELPIELCGILKSELSTIALVGLESGNISFLTGLLRKMSPPQLVKEGVQTQCNNIENWDITKLTTMEIIKLKILRYIVLDTDITDDNTMGETSEMKSRSIITPRKFTTLSSLTKLTSYNDYQDVVSDPDQLEALLEGMLENQELLVTKGESPEDFRKTILFRYNSKKFKESLSIQSPTQLFVEQILFSNKPVIDYTGIREKYVGAVDMPNNQEDEGIMGKKTIPEALEILRDDLSKMLLTLDDIKLVYSFCILNDPLNTTACNAILLSQIQSLMDRTSMSAVTMPEFRNMRLIKYSPALVLRAYLHGELTIGGAIEDDMKRDLYHLEEFIDQTGILRKVEAKIQAHEIQNGARDLLYEIRERTKFLQTCYDYIKSTEHRVKVFILPCKAYTAFDFCATIHGNLIKDKGWYSVHYLKQIISGTAKAIVNQTPASEQINMDECFRLISHFADTFIEPSSRHYFADKIIKEYSYKNIPVTDLYDQLKRDMNKRQHFMPLLYHMQELKQSDLDRYDANKTYEKVTWNNWQVNRDMSTGTIDLTIKGADRSMRILGEDDKLQIAELRLVQGDTTAVESHARRLLNAKHNLQFEKMQEYTYLEPGMFYICWQKRSKFAYNYQMLLCEIIENRNNQPATLLSGKINLLHPVCPAVISRIPSPEKIRITALKYMNQNCELSRLQLLKNEFATTRRCHFSKMTHFNGKEFVVGNIDINRLMATPTLLSVNYPSLSQTPLITLSQIFRCNGVEEEVDEFEFLSDEVLEDTDTAPVNAIPFFHVSYSTKSKHGYTYKQALQHALRIGLEEMENEFDFTGQNLGFFSSRNIGIISFLVGLVNRLNTNEWSTVMMKCIHMAFFNNQKDRTYHLFKIPKIFIKDPIGEKVDWAKAKDFLQGIRPRDETNHWGQMFIHFKNKCIDAIDLEIKMEGASWGEMLEMLDEFKDEGMFNFG
ncbi:RNA-dependent RNA polymerase [Orthobunyavirus guajaraense]|uniref:RNA-directed RNA polymerase L n=1 Tax=Orthobunyavirus guajaraense TaxID=3052395 RepID=A0A0R7FMY2_9VIRU|nr:RNA-dependent RNA polymerase [Orthobunyavirus guajaraense]AKO90159.1 RNA-dependent RNA polymerase [Orthobunyavirus guajaraense]